MDRNHKRLDPPELGATNGSRRIRVAIVENHQLVSESLGLLLDGQPDIEVVAYAGSTTDAAVMSPSVPLDVVIMDLHLEGNANGRDAARLIRQTHPGTRFVFLTRDDSDDAMLAAVEAGASAFLHKSRAASEVIDTVRKVAAGASLISPSTISGLLSRTRDRETIRESLTPRELEVLQLMSEGVASRQIAKRLGISYTTVRSHIRSIDAKLGAHSKIESVVTARDLELVN
jgi:two-component system, NarL family, response regulator DevR